MQYDGVITSGNHKTIAYTGRLELFVHCIWKNLKAGKWRSVWNQLRYLFVLKHRDIEVNDYCQFRYV